MFGRRKNDDDDVSDQFQEGMNLNKGQGGGYGGDDSGYGGGDTDAGYGGAHDTDTGYGTGQDSGYGGSNTDTGYGGRDGEGYGERKHHHHKKTDDDTEGGYGGQSGYGGGDTDAGYGGGRSTDTGYGGGHPDMGYGGGDALGGGQTGGDAFPSEETGRRARAADDTYGGDQTALDAGADTNYADTAGRTKQGADDTYGATGGAGTVDATGGMGAAAGQDRAYDAGYEEKTYTSLSSGESLRPGQTLTSPNGQSKLVFQGDGNIVLYKGSEAVWATGTDREQIKPIVMNVQGDGNVALYGEGDQFVGWATNTGGRDNVKLVASNSGKLVLLAEEECLWSSAPVDSNEAKDIACASAQAAY